MSLPLSPRTPGAPALQLSPAARSAPAAGSGGAATAGSRPLKRALTPHPLSHTRSHSLTHSLTLPYTQTERQPRTTAGTSSERGGGRGIAEHGRGCRKNVAKARATSGPPSSPLRSGCLPPPGPAPAGQCEGSRVAAAQSCRQTHHVDRPDGGQGPRLQCPECTSRRCCRPFYDSTPYSGYMGSVA